MQNIIEDNDHNINGNLKCKIFNGNPEEVQSQINYFLNEIPFTVDEILQSGTFNNITVTIFYYTENPANFIHKNIVARNFADDVYKYMEDMHGVTFEEILTYFVERIEEKKK
jgi:hypothetical protein